MQLPHEPVTYFDILPVDIREGVLLPYIEDKYDDDYYKAMEDFNDSILSVRGLAGSLARQAGTEHEGHIRESLNEARAVLRMKTKRFEKHEEKVLNVKKFITKKRGNKR